MDELLKAMQMFQQGVQQAATTTAINDATAAMQEINVAAIDDGQKRQALDQLSRQVAMRLTGAGASGTQIQSAFDAIAPQKFGSVEQMQLEGAMTGNQQMKSVSEQILNQRESRKGRELALQNKYALDLERQKGMMDIEREIVKAKLSGGAQSIPGFEFAGGTGKVDDKTKQELQKASATYIELMNNKKMLDEMVKEHGTEIIPSAVKDQMIALRGSISMGLKDLYGLGALAGPDVGKLDEILPDVSAFRNNTYFAKSDQLKKILDSNIDAKAKSRGARWIGIQGQEGGKASASSESIIRGPDGLLYRTGIDPVTNKMKIKPVR